MVQFLTSYTGPEQHNVQRLRQMDRRTDRQQYHANGWSVQYNRLKIQNTIYGCHGKMHTL